MTDEFWARYNGTKRREVARRPIEAIVREKEQLALAAMTGRAPVSVGVDWASGPDWTVTQLTPSTSFCQFRRQIAEVEEEIAKAIGGRAPSAPVALPSCIVGMPVRCVEPGFHFGREGVVGAYNEKYLVVRYEERFGFGNHFPSAWCCEIFPCDATLLPPGIGMRCALRLTGTTEHGTLAENDGDRWATEPAGSLMASYTFSAATHWLKQVWPIDLVKP